MGSGGGGGLKAEDQITVLKEEAMLNRMATQEERAYQLKLEKERNASDKAQRLLKDYEERSRVKEIDRLEVEGAEASENEASVIDTDTSLADLYAALSMGTDPINGSST